MTTASPTVEQATATVNRALIDAREAFCATVEAATLDEAERHAQRVVDAYDEAENEIGRWGNVLSLAVERIWIYTDLAATVLERRRQA